MVAPETGTLGKRPAAKKGKIEGENQLFASELLENGSFLCSRFSRFPSLENCT